MPGSLILSADKMYFIKLLMKILFDGILLKCLLGFVLVFLLFALDGCQSKTSGREISVDEVYAIITDSIKVNDYVLLDTRSRMDYVRGHLVSSIWLGPGSMENKIRFLSTEARPFIIYDSGMQRPMAADILLRNGITNLQVMNGGFSEWTKRGYPAAIQLVRNTSNTINIRIKSISSMETYEILKSADREYVIIDIRSYPAFEESHIKGSLAIPYVPINEFVVSIEEQNFARTTPIIIYCDGDSDIGEKATEVMLRNDFSQVYLLEGGMQGWSSKNYPIEYGQQVVN